MKIAILADIHGHFQGLVRITKDIEAWAPDMVIVNGDIINRGPNNDLCWQFVKNKADQHGWILIRGNHEEYVLKSTDPEAPTAGKKHELFQLTQFTYNQILNDIQDINGLPDRFAWRAPDRSQMLVMHGTVLGNRVGIMPDTPDSDIARRIAPAPSIFVTAHTHKPVVKQLGPTLVINVGSAGLPFDRDRRASYGQITWSAKLGWQAKIIRLDIDFEAAERAFFDSGFIPEAGPFSRLVLVEHRMARGLLHQWHREYEDAFNNGELSFEATVSQMLHKEEFREHAAHLPSVLNPVMPAN